MVSLWSHKDYVNGREEGHPIEYDAEPDWIGIYDANELDVDRYIVRVMVSELQQVRV